MTKPKPVNLSIQFGFPSGHTVRKASITPDGKLIFTDASGSEVIPEYMERSLYFERPKGPKVQVKHRMVGGLATIGGLDELTLFDSVIVIDTNGRTINGEDIRAACFVRCRFIQQDDNSVRIVCDEEKLNILELHNVKGNPELLAILKIAVDISAWPDFRKNSKIAFVTDSALGAHEAICSRKMSIYGPYLLPPGFSLLYASGETGREAVNKLLKYCDSQATAHLIKLEQGTAIKSDLHVLPEDNNVKYRYISQTGLEIVNPVVKGTSLEPGTKISLYGIRKDR